MARTAKQKLEETVAKPQDPIIEQTSESVETVPGNSDRVKEGIRPAFYTYLEGRKGLADAFDKRVHQDQEAYRDADRRYRLCEEAIEKAMEAREKAESDALNAYREDVDRASAAYKERMEQALIQCKQRVMDSWKNSMEISTQMTGVYGEKRNILNRTLLAINQRVMRALEVRHSS